MEFQAQRKPLGGVLPLWVKARRRGHTLQIEWEVPVRKTTEGWIRRHLPKGKSVRYSAKLLAQEIKKALPPAQAQEAIALVLAFEERFAQIRQAACGLTEVRRAWERYSRYKDKIENRQGHTARAHLEGWK